MPHISILHSPNLSAFVESILPDLNFALKEAAPNMTGIKLYGIAMASAYIDDDADNQLLHLNLRVAKKPDRSPEIIELWLRKLANIITENQPDNCTFTAEANFLPESYMSKTF